VIEKNFQFEDKDSVNLAIRIYRFESKKVSGPGSNKRDINQILWTKKEIIDSLRLNQFDILKLEKLLNSLKQQNYLMIVPKWKNGQDGFVTKTAETIRLLGHTYEYWNRGRPGIDATRWEIVPKYIPLRNISVKNFIERLIHSLENKGIDTKESKLAQSCKEVIEGVAGKIAGSNTFFSEFQFDATLKGLLDGLGIGSKKGSILVAGVGSGKTLAFMLPPLILAKRDILAGKSEYGAHLFVYPRTALALDQFSKSLLPYAIAAGIPENQIHSEMSNNYRKLGHSRVGTGIRSVHNSISKPRLIITSLETLKRRITHPIIVKKLLNRVNSLTIDEVHLVSGVQGAQIAMLLRRLKKLCPEQTVWNGASATIAKPEEHLGRLIGCNHKDINLVIANPEDMEIDGVVHHAFIRPSGIISTSGALVNATSLMIHNRRTDLSIRPTKKKDREKNPKSIAFADNLELLGRWNNDLRENERTDVFNSGRIGTQRNHPTEQNIEEWDRRQREIPYAARFQEPLSRRIKAEGGILPESEEKALLPVLQGEIAASNNENPICKRCKSGERIELGNADKETMKELAKLVHRFPHFENDKFVPFMIENPIFDSEGKIGTLDMCPYLRAGACTWFAKTPVDKVARIGNSGGKQRWDFAGCATSKIQSSKSDKNEDADDLSDAIFEASYEELYNVKGAVGTDFVNIVMASPTLEVGVDLPNLTESILHKAVRNIASYRQKVGRVGRESMSEALNVTLVTDSPIDLHYYRQPRKLVDKGRLDAVPLKERNEAIAFSTAYLSIWDWVNKNCTIPYDLTMFTVNVASDVTEQTLDKLKNSKSLILNYVSSVLNDERFNENTEWIESARLQVIEEIELLLMPISGYEFEPKIESGANCLTAIISINKGGSAIPTAGVSDTVREYDNIIKRAKKERNKLGWLESFDEEILEKIDYLINSKTTTIEILEDLVDHIIDIIDENEFNRKNLRALKKFRQLIEDLITEIEELEDLKINMRSFRLIEQFQRLCTSNRSWKKSYLSDIIYELQIFKELRKNSWFVSPETLFIHPHTENVTLVTENENELNSEQSQVTINEALHRFLPGMWTMSFPQGTFKVSTKETQSVGEGGNFKANIDLISEDKTIFRTIENALPAPPGRPENRTIRVVTPRQIKLIKNKNARYIAAAKGTSKILDYDEGKPIGMENRMIRIPRSFSNQWLNINLDEGEKILPYIHLSEGEKLVVTSNNGRDEREIENHEIIHPFQKVAFKDVKWHNEIKVIEYTYGLSRTVSSEQGFGGKLEYSDGYGNDVAFGQKINTEGISLELHQNVVEQTKEQAYSKIKSGEKEFLPTCLRAIKAFLTIEGNKNGSVSRFEIEDTISIIISYWNDNNNSKLGIEEIVRIVNLLSNNSIILRKYTTRRINAKLGTHDDEGELNTIDIEERDSRVHRLDRVFTGIVSSLSHSDKFLNFLPLWIHRTILMSFGITAVNSLQKISGGDNGEIGYGLTDDSWKGDASILVIYDRAEKGNGNTAVARTFLHIPNIVRTSRGTTGKLLPSNDYMSILEEEMLSCPQHHSDILGLDYLKTNGEDSKLHLYISDLKADGEEVYRVSGKTWKKLGITKPKDGWKLPLLHLIRRELAIEEDLEKDDVTRATKICWNGCPECIDRIDMVQGGNAGLDYLDSSLLDQWFRFSRLATNDYKHLKSSDLISGDNPLLIGSLHTLALSTQNQRFRSSLQPWTIGLDIPRAKMDDEPEILIRESDVVGLRRPISTGGVVMATPSTGVKRLFWFDLLMTAYLDISKQIPDNRKEITLVYYDARNISFDDVGIAPRMLESIKQIAKEDGVEDIEKLSDILIWLAKRNFKIKLCLDKGVYTRDRNIPVRKFVEKLHNSYNENIELLWKEIIDPDGYRRSMHKKILITPIYALSGSANLTISGSGGNEEIEGHVTYGTSQYNDIVTTCNDTLRTAEKIIL
jgi:superfamily II DNA or RNA helicase